MGQIQIGVKDRVLQLQAPSGYCAAQPSARDGLRKFLYSLIEDMTLKDSRLYISSFVELEVFQA